MIDKFIRKIESLTKEQISACLLVVLLAGFSLGFGFGKGIEYSIEDRRSAIQPASDNYKLDLIYQTELKENEKD